MFWILNSVSVSAHSLLAFQYYDTQYCLGTPDILFTFPVMDPYANYKPENETWPDIYVIGAPTYPFSYCGNSYIDFDGYCCISVIDDGLSNGYKSGFAIEVDKESPSGLNGGVYCSIDGFGGYTNIQVRADGECKDERFVCHGNGTLQVFGDGTGCSEISTSLSLTEEVQIYNVNGSDTTGRLIRYKDNQGTVSWTVFVPPYDLVPTYTRLGDYVGLVFIISGIVCSLYPCYYTLLEYKSKRQKTLLLWFISQLMLFLWTSVRIAYIHIVFDKEVALIYTAAAVHFLHAIATLSIAFYSCDYLLSLFQFKWVKTSYTIVFGVHFALIGNHYFYWVYSTTGVAIGAEAVMEQWRSVNFLYIPILFLFNLLPIIYTILIFSRKAKRNIIIDEKLIQYLVMHISNCVLYFVVKYIQNFTLLLQNDRNYFTSEFVILHFIALHASLNVFMLSRLKRILRPKQRVDATLKNTKSKSTNM